MRILAVSAHLDDAELACGGTLARAVAEGAQVKVLVLSDSSYTDLNGTVLRTRAQALEEGQEACRILGIQELEVLSFPTKDIPSSSTAVEAVDVRIRAFKPDVMVTHWPFDTHQDHRATGLSALSAARYVNSVLMYEPIFPSGRSFVGFRPQVYVDIGDFLEVKLRALRAHKSQHEKYGERWIDAVRARCTLRGFEMGPEGQAGEAFEALRFEWRSLG